MKESKIKTAIAELAALVGGVGLLCQAGAWLWQSYWFLKIGHWVPMPALEYLGKWVDSLWLFEPNTWIGVHKILNSLNFGTALMLACFLLAAFLASTAKDQAGYRNK